MMSIERPHQAVVCQRRHTAQDVGILQEARNQFVAGAIATFDTIGRPKLSPRIKLRAGLVIDIVWVELIVSHLQVIGSFGTSRNLLE
jgi:hypothetical protein